MVFKKHARWSFFTFDCEYILVPIGLVKSKMRVIQMDSLCSISELQKTCMWEPFKMIWPGRCMAVDRWVRKYMVAKLNIQKKGVPLN